MLQWRSVILTKENIDPYLARYVNGDKPPFNAELMSKVKHPDDWDPQFLTYPMDLDILWTDIPKPGGWTYPDAYQKAKQNGEFEKMAKIYKERGERAPAPTRMAEDQARALAARLLEAAGAQPSDADAVARSLVAAEHAGQSGHGLARLPGYVGRLRAGGTVSGPWRLLRGNGPVESYDGQAGLGHVHLEQAVERAAALAAEHGVGVVGVAGSNHAGALGTRARALAERGLVALIFTNAPAVLAPPGGSGAVLGTNPIALAAPVPDGPPLVCDLATAQVSRGQVMRAAQEGRPIPPGWALDAAGAPTQDPAAALAGTLMPLGGAKGFALALLVEVLTGALLGPAVGPEIADFFGDGLDDPQNVSHLVVALDPAALGEPAAFLERMARLRDAVHAAGPPGATRLPGARAAAGDAAAGDAVEIGAGLAATLARLGDELGVAMPGLSGS